MRENPQVRKMAFPFFPSCWRGVNAINKSTFNNIVDRLLTSLGENQTSLL